MTDAFISYSRKDQTLVRQIADTLTTHGRDIWVDWEDIPLTADWWQQIQQGIEGSDAFILVISANSLTSVICHLELAHALQHNKHVIPIVIETPDERLMFEHLAQVRLEASLQQMLGSRQLDELVKANWQRIAQHNWLIFSASVALDTNAAKLIEALNTDPTHVNQHTRLLVRALEWDKRGRDNSFVLNGSEITEAETWLAQGLDKEPLPTQLHAEYITASRSAANQRQRRLFAGTAVALIATIGLAILAALFGIDARQQSQLAQENEAIAIANEQTAISNRIRADNNAATATVAQGLALIEADNAATQAAIAVDSESTAVAERDRADEQARLALSRQLAAQSDALLDDDLEIAMLLAVEAQRTANTYEAQDSLLRVLEARTQISQYLWGHDGLVRSLAVSPDGQYIASGGDDSTIRIWEAATGRGYGLSLDDLGLVTALYFTEDNRLFSATSTETLSEWDIATGTVLSYSRLGILGEGINVLDDDGIGEQAAAFTRDGRSIVTVDTANQIQMLDVATGELDVEIQPALGSMLTMTSDPTQLIDAIAVHPQGEYVAAMSGTDIRLFHLEDGASEVIFQEQQLVSVNGAFSPDGQYFVWYRYPVSEDGEIDASQGATPSLEIFDLTTERTVNSIALENTQLNFITEVAFDQASRTVFIGSNAGYVAGIDLETGEIVVPPIRIFTTDILTLTYEATRNRVIAGGRDGRLALVDLDTQSQLARSVSTESITGSISEIELRESDSLFAASVNGNEVAVLEYITGEAQLPAFKPYEDEEINALALHPSEALIATLSLDTDMMRLWDFSSGSFELVLEGEHLEAHDLTFSPDGHWLVSHGFTDEIYIWDVSQRAFAYSANTVVREDVFSFPIGGNLTAAFHPDGDYLLTTGLAIDEMHAWSLNEEGLTLMPEVSFEIPTELSNSSIWTMTFSPDGRRLAAGLLDGYLLMWDTSTGELVVEALQISGNPIHHVIFEPDGRTLAVTPLGSTEIYLFDAETGRRFGSPLQSQRGGIVSDIAFTSDGQELIASSGDELYAWPFDVELWTRTACRRVNTVWDPADWMRIVGDVPYRITCPEVALTQADELALRGDLDGARELFEQLVAADDIRENGEIQTAICRLGALGELAETIISACNRATELRPDNAVTLESRGIANALLGNYALAAADLRQVIALEPEANPQRDNWLLTLDAGNNPFDGVIRRGLRNQFAEETVYLLTSVEDLEVIPDHILMTPDEVTDALDALALPFYPLTFSGNSSPLRGWSITRTAEVDYEGIGILRNAVVPGARGFRYVLTLDRNDEQFIGVAQSDGPYETLDDWVDDLGMLSLLGSSERLEVNGVEVYHTFDETSHFYFFIHNGVHTVVLYPSEAATYNDEAITVISDLTRPES
jgi:WD40 repeat protein